MKGLLLDTCTLLWHAGDSRKLSGTARSLIHARAHPIFVSSFSAFEIGTKSRKGKLDLPLSAEEWFRQALDYYELRDLPVDWRIAAAATALPPLHNDPADRIIIATAKLRELTIVTPDNLIAGYPDVTVAW